LQSLKFKTKNEKILLLATLAVALYSCKNLADGEYEITGTVKE